MMLQGYSEEEALWEVPLTVVYMMEHADYASRGVDVTGQADTDELFKQFKLTRK